MEPIDRITPTQRPSGKAQGYQRWRDLLFLHWTVPEQVLRSLVPPALEIDTYDGNAYVGLVPFAMLGVRPAWLPERMGFDFLETNVRTYVHAGGRDPGVYFFSLEAASWLAVHAARLGWGLPYHHARMRMDKANDCITYESRRRSGTEPRLTVRYRIGRELGASAPGMLEHFLFERYLLHVVRGSSLRIGQVHHTPYPVWTAELEECSDELMAAGGLPAPTEPPALCHYSPGVDVEVFALRRQQ
jgi:uncharacterized protein YqjF (DUF2071 family)